MNTRLSLTRIDSFALTLFILISLMLLPLAGMLPSLADLQLSSVQPTFPQQIPVPDLLAEQVQIPVYNFYQSGAAVQAGNPAQGFEIAIGSTGLVVSDTDGAWDWQLALTSWGYWGALQPAGKPTRPEVNTHNGQAYDWAYGSTLSEWVRNRPESLEHGFTIFEPPTKKQGQQPLILEMDYLGTYRPETLPGMLGIRFVDQDGQVRLTYDHLAVFDAAERILPATIRVIDPGLDEQARLQIRIDDSGAIYPLTVDPYLTTFSAQLLADDGGAGDQFGRAVAVNGDIAVVGAPGGSSNDPNTTPTFFNDAAYIYYRNEGTADGWGQVKKLDPPGVDTEELFGLSVSVAGDIVAVGAPTYAATGQLNRGAVYIFARNAGGADNWGQVARLTAPDGADGDKFGWDIALDGQHLVVGSPNHDQPGLLNIGAVYVFSRNQGGADNWGFEAKLNQPFPQAGDRLGYSVDVHGDQIVAGAPYRTGTGGVILQGAAYAFKVDLAAASGWSAGTEIISEDPASYDYFGWDVAIYHEHLVASAPLKNDQRGAAYIFERNLGGVDNWGQVEKLLPLEGSIPSQFGIAVDLSHDSVVIGAYTWFPNTDNPGRGAAYLYERNQTGPDAWGQVVRLLEPSGLASIFFGRSVSIDDSALIIGANGFDVGGETDQGAAFTYYRSGSSWELVAEPVANDPGSGDDFGCSLASTTEYLAVGACHHDASQGKVYLYYRNQGGVDNWGLWTTLTASDGAAGDQFGSALAIGEDKLLVGAPGADNDQGAVYVYNRNQGGADAWGQQQILADSSGSSGDLFGTAVDIYLDQAAIGAPGASSGAGAVYIFRRTVDPATQAEPWQQVQRKTQSGSGALGSSVAINSGQLLAGAPTTNGSGRAYIFYRNLGGADNWGVVKTLPSTSPAAGDAYGTAVDLHAGRAAVGAPGAGSQRGAVYLYAVNQGGTDNWGQVRAITTGQVGDRRGDALDLEGDMLAVGAPGANSAYTYKRNQGGADAWNSFGALSGLLPGQNYGAGVAMLEDILAVGAPAANGGAGKAYVYLLTELFQDLGISKSASVSRVGPGDQIRFDIVFDNQGDSEATGVVITDTLPAELTGWTSSFAGVNLQEIDQGIWTATSISPDSSGTITLTGTVPADAVSGIYTNTIEIQANEAEIYYNNNIASVSFEIDATPPVPPVRTSPADGTVFTATNDVTMEWRASSSPDVAGYLLRINGTVINTTQQQVTANNLADGTYNWQVAAYDDLGNTSAYSDIWTYTVDTGLVESLPPVANAGPDQSALPGEPVTIDGSSSFDPDGQTPLSYTWTQIGGPVVSFTADQPSFTITAPAAPSVLTFELVVRDIVGLASSPDRVSVIVTNSGGFEIYIPVALKAE